MFDDFRISTKKRPRTVIKKKRILLTLDAELIRDLNRVKPKSVTRQEAIRQIVEFYVYQQFFK